LKKIAASGYDNWDAPEILMAAVKAPFPEMMAFLKHEHVCFERFFDDLTAGKLYMAGDIPAVSPKFDKKTASERLRNAVENNRIKKAEYWLQNGADVNYCPYTEKDIDAKKGVWYIHTLPMIAMVRSLKMAELLIAHGAKLNDVRILPYVTRYQKLDVVRCLVEHGAKYDTGDPKKNLLCDAVAFGDLKLFKYLHSLGFDLNKGVTDQGKSPLQEAAEWANSEVLRYLLENGAKVRISDTQNGLLNNEIGTAPGRSDANTMKCLQVLADFKFDIRICALLDNAAIRGMTKVAKFLLDRGCPVEEYSPDKKTMRVYPLHSCIFGSHENKLEMIDLLMSHGANVNGIDRYGGSPLRMAVKKAAPEVVAKLLQYGADPNLQDNKSRAILLEALYQKPQTKVLKIVKLLVEHGADTKIRYLGETPIQIARNYEMQKVVEYFKELGVKR